MFKTKKIVLCSLFTNIDFKGAGGWKTFCLLVNLDYYIHILLTRYRQ